MSSGVGHSQPIIRKIDSGNVKLPLCWSNFMSNTLNKSELQTFLSNELQKYAEQVSFDCELVFGGGFSVILKLCGRQHHETFLNCYVKSFIGIPDS